MSFPDLLMYIYKNIYNYFSQQPPFVFKNENGEWDGYCIDLLKALQKLINFEYELYEAPVKQYGRMDENMEWNGAVKELIDEVNFRSDEAKVV